MTEKRAKILTAVITLVIFGVVGLLGSGKIPKPAMPEMVKSFPGTIAIINGITSLVLVFSFLAIKNKKVSLHKKLNLVAMILSLGFLVLYVATHFFIPDTRYGDTNHDGVTGLAEKTAAGATRIVYLVILISHITLAMVVFPMVLMSYYYGWKNDIKKHRKLTRYSFPLWLYVTVTGVVVYLMISPYYNF